MAYVARSLSQSVSLLSPLVDKAGDYRPRQESHGSPITSAGAASADNQRNPHNGDLKAARIAGGWKDAATFMSYIRTSMDDIRRAIADPRVEIVLPGDETARPKGGPVLRLFGGRRPSAFQRNG